MVDFLFNKLGGQSQEGAQQDTFFPLVVARLGTYFVCSNLSKLGCATTSESQIIDQKKAFLIKAFFSAIFVGSINSCCGYGWRSWVPTYSVVIVEIETFLYINKNIRNKKDRQFYITTTVCAFIAMRSLCKGIYRPQFPFVVYTIYEIAIHLFWSQVVLPNWRIDRNEPFAEIKMLARDVIPSLCISFALAQAFSITKISASPLKEWKWRTCQKLGFAMFGVIGKAMALKGQQLRARET